MAAHQCRVCRGTRGSDFYSNQSHWLRCDECLTIEKLLSFEEYQALNPTYDPGAYLDSSDRHIVEQVLRVDNARRTLQNILQRYDVKQAARPEPRSFLDVGCGMGAYLLAAQQLGFQVLGFEPSADHARVATKVLQLPVVGDYFTLERVGESRFDFIMLSHVIEHIYAPKEFLHRLLSVLNPGGILVVITPNSDSLIARVTAGRWPILKPVDHVTLISSKGYEHFGLEQFADVHHFGSEYPFEFAATLAAALRDAVRTKDPHVARPSAPALRQVSLKARLLRGAFTIASAPATLLAAATGKRACLNTVIVRRH